MQGIELILLQFLNLSTILIINNFTSIQIICDNDNAINWITMQQRTKDSTYIQIINKIYAIMEQIYKTYNIITERNKPWYYDS